MKKGFRIVLWVVSILMVGSVCFAADIVKWNQMKDSQKLTPKQMQTMVIEGIKAKPKHFDWNPDIVCKVHEITIPEKHEMQYRDTHSSQHLDFLVVAVFDTVNSKWLNTFRHYKWVHFRKINNSWVFDGCSWKFADGSPKPQKKEYGDEMLLKELKISKDQASKLKANTISKTSFDNVYNNAVGVTAMPDCGILVNAFANALGHGEKIFNTVLGSGMSERVYELNLTKNSVQMKSSKWLTPGEKFYAPVNVAYRAYGQKNGQAYEGGFSRLYGVVFKKGKNGFYVAGSKPLGPEKGMLSNKVKDKKATYHDKFAKATK